MRAFGSVDSVEEARGRVEGRCLEGSLDAFGSGLLGGSRGHVQARALSLQLGLARADCVLGSCSKSGVARGDVVFDALVQAVHVIGGCCEGCMRYVGGVVCVWYIFGVCVACDVVCLAALPTTSYFVCAKAGPGARGTRRHSSILQY